MVDDKILFKELIPHVFLPLELPGEPSANIIAEENCLISLLLQKIRETLEFIPQIKKTCSVFETWIEIQANGEREPSRIRNAIQTLQPGQLFALYVRAQNCGLLINVPKGSPGTIVWSTFPASQKSKTVTDSLGDLQILYPATSIEIKRSDVLHSESFARQLGVLMSHEFTEAMPVSVKAGNVVTEIRDVSDNRFISGWLPSLLVTQDSIQSFDDIPQITKKARDSVVYGKALLPFRRSGMWTTAKVVLNISLVRDFDDIRGLFLYKIILIKTMLAFLESPEFPHGESTGIEMLKKVGRRVRKLEKFKNEIPVVANSDLTVLYDSLIKDATKFITSARNQIDMNWKKIIDAAKNNSVVALTGAEFDMTQSLSGNGLLNYLTSSRDVQVKKYDVPIPHVPPRHRINLQKKYIHNIPQSVPPVFGLDISIILFDFERNVWQNWNDVISLEDSDYVWKMYHEYLNSAFTYYKNDPVGMSRLIITTLKMIQVWDQCVGRQYPLVKEHKIGIQPTFVHMLLVTTKEELDIVNTLEAYFQMRENAPNSSLLEQRPDFDSFAVRFAAQSADMETLRELILEEGRKCAEQKMDEVRKAKLYCESLRAKISGLTHTYYTIRYNPREQAHYGSCELCKLESELKNYRVQIYEKPLPEDIHLQQAVVCELLIPGAIASLRDLLFTFGSKIVTSIGEKKDTNVVGAWSEDSQLLPHNRRSSQYITNLGSTTIHVVNSHYSECHPDKPLDAFVLKNGYNVCYTAHNKTIAFNGKYGCHIKEWCTLKVESGSEYASMQWAINGNSQTPNEVLARQSECHRNMSTSEFVEFGSLRCYTKQQIRNLIRAIVLGTLSFKNASVFNLICQSLWECSPLSRTENGVREAHEDFLDAKLLNECLVIMENLVAKHSDNWQNPYVLLMVVVFAVSVAEKTDNEEVLDVASTLLLKCRDVSTKWSKGIQEIISKMTSEDTVERDKLTLKLVEINICSSFSFGAHKQLGSRTFSTSEHVKNWFQAIVVVYDHMLLVSKNAPFQIVLLMRRIIELGVDIEIYLKMSNYLNRGFNKFLRSSYGGADNLDLSEETLWLFYENTPQVYTKANTNETVTLQLDIVSGNFLVNGCTISRLPQAIEQHEDYERVFPAMSFEVQPLGPNEVVTKYAYEGSYYSFILNEEILIVEEIITGTSGRRTLIPSKYLPENFPHQFEHEYSHWWNEEKQAVEFFPKHSKKPLKIMGIECELLLDISGRRLKHLESGRFLVDIRCRTFQLIAKVLNRLESTPYIHVWEIDGKYTIELPRMRLSFVVTGFGKNNNNIAITSLEYEGMKVAEQQQLETLVGIQQGLLLTNDVETMLLVPHGIVDLKGHHCTSISTHSLLEPPYFRYDVDERLGQLKAGETQTGWFYLAYLHAVTSSFIPDPLTGVTGTERAFQILNAGVCFPSQPFSSATIRIIHLLRSLAPTRTYYPKHLQVMETVKWPSHISPLAAHDNFVDVIENIVEKSDRLVFLFDGVERIKLEDKGANDLRSKAIWRRAIISNGINGIETISSRRHRPLAADFSFSAESVTRCIHLSHLCHLNRTELPTLGVFDLLTKLLLLQPSLQAGFGLRDLCCRTVSDWVAVDFTNSWLGIYEAARKVEQSSKKYDWIMFLSCLTFRQNDTVSINQLSILNAIAQHGEIFHSINPPEYSDYSDTSQYEYDESQIEDVLSSCISTSLSDYVSSQQWYRTSNETSREFQNRMKPKYQSECRKDLRALENGIRDHWPCATISELICNRPTDEYYDWSKAHDDVNALLTKWFKNRELHMFLQKVSTTLQNNVCAVHVVNQNASGLTSSMLQVPSSAQCQSRSLVNEDEVLVRLEDFVSNNFKDELLDRCNLLFQGYVDDNDVDIISPKKKVDNFPLKECSESRICDEFFNDLHISWDQWQLQKSLYVTEAKRPPSDRTLCNYTSTDIWFFINDSVKRNSEIYSLCDWFPRITPTTLLPLICKTFEDGTPMSNLRKLLGGYAVTITQEQQHCRTERYRRQGNDLNLLEMKNESSNSGHSKWSPDSRPEWLLLEIENDFLIRPLQIKVAEHMQSPDDGKNSLMQMNMGEGKTAVIIPLVALSLADGKRLCRITVLRSLYQINLKSLSLKIGGLLLNRRVYTMPCRRDYPIEAGNINKMVNAYQECFDEKGVFLTLAEHRLSFELKKHEKALAESYSDSTAINEVLNWLQSNARDVLDESDEILQVKYQLLYTLGEPLTINGGSLRWTITQQLLRLVPNRMKLLLKSKQFKDQIELKEASSGQEFPHCRVLSENVYEQLCSTLCHDVIAIGLIPEPMPALKHVVVKFLAQEILNGDEMQQLYESSCFASTTHKDTLLILRGLLACGVLRSCLSKRWRVNYGVSPTGHRRMAVPFRAKDVAAERAEFGHPDVAIVLTLLSYYYSGLSDEQLEDAFTRLFKLNFAEEEYQTWIALLPPTTPGLESMKKLSGINLRDYRQKYNVVFPALRRNMATIDFWLGQAVFPVESKQFGSKIGCSAWDLCRDNTSHPTTGFSGTNDTKLLLPRTIQQSDLPELLGTNGKVLENLLRPENDQYDGLESHISAKEIIQKLVEGKIRVLLDVGAIMLELTNEKVADEWMLQCRDIEAVVFFDDKDHLLVKTRLAPRPTQFETSPFRNRLDSCAIYLDEIHTRGTDLKIPLGTTAVVTLGKGVRKDTLAQACMRMRKLGQGHTIRFWGSNEVHPQIGKFASENKPPGSYAVLRWAIQNSVHFMEEGFIHWAGSGTYELQKQTAEKICDANESKLSAKLYSQNEVLELMSMYGLEKSLLVYPAIAKNMIDRSVDHLRSNLIGSSHSVCANEIRQDSRYMLQRLEKYVGQLQRTSNILDEEQERELEHELEEETEVEPPPKATAQKHVFNEQLRTFIKTGNKSAFIEIDLLPLKNVFFNSELWNYCKTATSWGHGSDFNVRATPDFERTVVQTFEKKSNDFLRPVSWIYNTVMEGLNFAILMSPYELNECWNDFKTGNGTLHMYGPRIFRDQETLHESGPLMIPSRHGTHSVFPDVMTATLDILAGSFNFRNESDERSYCCVAGISPKPRPPEEEELFENGGIVNGFIDPIQRKYLPMFSGVSAFEEHPESLIRGIIEARHGVFTEKSHTGIVIVYGRKNFTS